MATRQLSIGALGLVLLAFGCGSLSILEDGAGAAPDALGGGRPWERGAFIPPEPTEQGDPALGREILLNGNYMSCGFPASKLDVFGSAIDSAFGVASDAPRIADRRGPNADLAYNVNQFTTESGVEVVNINCLNCHGGMFNGELIIGMGDPTLDYTEGLGGAMSSALGLDGAAYAELGFNEAEVEQMDKLGRLSVLNEVTRMRTVGNNPAEALTVILVSYHDQDTLEWIDDPGVTTIVVDHDGEPIAEPIMTSDPPPWWRVHKKNALFYNGMARGDHRGTMSMATAICVDTLEEAKRVDGLFVDIHAFVTSVRAPKYPFEIDDELAAHGEQIFLETCAGCHGTYGETDEDDTYPNLLIPLDVIGTDPVVAEGGTVHAPQVVEWYNGSFYGQITRMEVNDPFPGYMPPPLDGVWATAPFLHNGSVPNIEMMLNSTTRPRYWKRIDYDSENFDEATLGWPHEEVDYPQAEAPEDERKFVYDTDYWSQSNAGHTFGDHFNDGQRSAVIEYLKTL